MKEHIFQEGMQHSRVEGKDSTGERNVKLLVTAVCAVLLAVESPPASVRLVTCFDPCLDVHKTCHELQALTSKR